MQQKMSTGYRMISALDKFTQNLDLTLSLQIPLGPSGLHNSSLSFSLGQAAIQLKTSEPQQPISPPSQSDLEAIGNSDSQLTTGDQVP